MIEKSLNTKLCLSRQHPINFRLNFRRKAVDVTKNKKYVFSKHRSLQMKNPYAIIFWL